MNMNPNMMGGMGSMNPMQQMMWNMLQQNMGGGQQMQQMPYMRGGGMDCDEFEECLEKYCREVANGRREVPRAFKKMVKKAWQGAKDAVSGGRYGGRDDEDEDEDEDTLGYTKHRKGSNRYSGGKKGGDFWEKIDKLRVCKGNAMKMNEEMMRLFPSAKPEHQMVIRKLAEEMSIDERAQRCGMNAEDFRKTINRLMQDDED